MKPLKGVRIVDLSMGWAGPLTTRHMADLGADVIKVESCERFDWWRSWEATPQWIADDGAEKSVAFNMVNRHKRNITLDLDHAKGRELLLELVGKAHAVVENFSGGVLPKLDLSYEIFRDVNEQIILLSMPAFGSTGPWKDFRAYGSTVEQSSGLPHLNGTSDLPPTMQHVAYGDAAGGLTGAGALLTALRHQARTGEGQFVDLSQVEGLFPLGAHGLLAFAASGKAPERYGNRHPDYAPHGVYPCLGDDRWVVIQASDNAQWARLAHLIGASAAGFTSAADRLARATQVDQVISAWTKAHDADELMFTLQAAGVTAAAAHSAAQLMQDTHLKSRNYWQWLERAVVGSQPNPSAPYRHAGDVEPLPIEHPAPTLGQHNEDVLIDLLGLSAEAVQALEAQGIIGNKPRMPRTKKPRG